MPRPVGQDVPDRRAHPLLVAPHLLEVGATPDGVVRGRNLVNTVVVPQPALAFLVLVQAAFPDGASAPGSIGALANTLSGSRNKESDTVRTPVIHCEIRILATEVSKRYQLGPLHLLQYTL